MSKLNEKLNVGDKVKCLMMKGEPKMTGKIGVVKSSNHVFNDIHYQIDWEKGGSLDLLSDSDVWVVIKKSDNSENSDNLTESVGKFKSMRDFIRENKDLMDCIESERLVKFLVKLRECGYINMFQASIYLYAGKENIKKMHPFNEDSEPCDEMLELADEAKNIMIEGTICMMEKKGIEINIDRVNSQIRRTSRAMLEWYMLRH